MSDKLWEINHTITNATVQMTVYVRGETREDALIAWAENRYEHVETGDVWGDDIEVSIDDIEGTPLTGEEKRKLREGFYS
jgi:hypothetical protein